MSEEKLPEKKVKHLEMIEAIIERMAKNSFQLKGWAMTLVAAIIALSTKDADQRFILFALIPVLGFWVLDSFYLQQERKYKELYTQILVKEEKDIDFSMDTSLIKTKRTKFLSCMFAKVEWIFYLLIIAAVALLLCCLGMVQLPHFCNCGTGIK